MSTELAWAAGFFEGEGWVTKNSTRTLTLGVGQSGSTLELDRFAAAVGLGNVKGPYEHSGKGTFKTTKPRYMWSASGKKAHAVMAKMRPFLTPETPKLVKYDGLLSQVV